jgi:hypothetical protein
MRGQFFSKEFITIPAIGIVNMEFLDGVITGIRNLVRIRMYKNV